MDVPKNRANDVLKDGHFTRYCWCRDQWLRVDAQMPYRRRGAGVSLPSKEGMWGWESGGRGRHGFWWNGGWRKRPKSSG